jgi:hypothetical protein
MTRWDPQPAHVRVLARTHREGDCLIYDGCNLGGYGTVRDGDKIRKVHRVVYEAVIGPIPLDLTIDHLCCRTDCVNVVHMQVVTSGENAALKHERLGEGRARRQACVICGTEFVPRMRAGITGTRWCSRACHTAWRRANQSRATYEHQCEVCDATFTSIKRQARTCGHSCRGRLARASRVT